MLRTNKFHGMSVYHVGVRCVCMASNTGCRYTPELVSQSHARVGGISLGLGATPFYLYGHQIPIPSVWGTYSSIVSCVAANGGRLCSHSALSRKVLHLNCRVLCVAGGGVQHGDRVLTRRRTDHHAAQTTHTTAQNRNTTHNNGARRRRYSL
jgi:hypothetical protein